MSVSTPGSSHSVGCDCIFAIRLPGGRILRVDSFQALPAYFGVLEGLYRPQANENQRRLMRSIAEKEFGGPLVVFEPVTKPVPSSTGDRRERLPSMACMARLSSEPFDPEMMASSLTLVWWQEVFTGTLPEEIARAAAGLDWEASAKDWDFW